MFGRDCGNGIQISGFLPIPPGYGMYANSTCLMLDLAITVELKDTLILIKYDNDVDCRTSTCLINATNKHVSMTHTNLLIIYQLIVPKHKHNMIQTQLSLSSEK